MDQFYFESGYIDDKYFVYIAAGASAPSSDFSLSCLADSFAIVSASASLSSVSNISTQITRVREFDTNWSGILSASITANVTRDGDIDLYTSCSLSASVSVIPATIITLTTIANLNAQAAYQVDNEIDPIQSTVSLSALPGKSKTGSALFSTKARIYVGKWVGTNRPYDFEDYIQVGQTLGDLNTTDPTPKFGSGRYRGEGYIRHPNRGLPSIKGMPGSDDDWVLELFYLNHTNAATSGNIFTQYQNITASGLRLRITATRRLTLLNGATALWTDTNSLNKNQWYHILLLHDTNGLSLYLDGSRKYNSTSNWSLNDNGYWYIGDGWTGIDEFSVHESTLGYSTTSSTITVPTAARVNNYDTTRVLLHFDQSLLDDLRLTESATASLSSSANIFANVDYTAGTSANLSSDFTVSAVIGVIKPFGSIIDSTADLTASVNRTTTAESTIDSDFFCEGTAFRTRPGASTESLAATQTASVNAIFQTQVDFTGAFTSTMTVAAILRPLVYLESDFTQTAQITVTATAASDLAATATQTASAVKTTDVVSDLSSDHTVTANAGRLVGISSDQSTTSDITVVIDRILDVDSVMSASLSLTTTAYRIKQFNIGQFSAFTQIAAAVKTTDVISDQASQAVQLTSASRTRDCDSTQTASFTQTAQAVKTPGVIITMASSVIQAATVVKTVVVSVEQEAVATALTAVAINATGTVLLESQTTLTATVGIVHEFLGANTRLGVRSTTENNLDDGGFLRYTGSSPDLATNFVVSFWSARPVGCVFDSNPQESQILNTPIMFSGTLGFDNDYLTYYGSEGIIDSVNYSGGYVSWNLNYLNLTENVYHHFLLAVNLKKSTNAEKYRLYVDGQLVGQHEITYRVGDQWVPIGSAWNLPLEIGSGFNLMMNTGTDGSFVRAYENFDGFGQEGASLHQFYWDWKTYGQSQITDYPVDTVSYRQKFYDQGWRDLGQDGTLTGLDQPKHFIRLNDFIDIQDTGSQAISGQWKALEFQQDMSPNNWDRWNLINYSADFDDLAQATLGNQIIARALLSTTVTGVFLYVIDLDSDSQLTATATRILAFDSDLTATATASTDISVAYGPSITVSTLATVSTDITKITGYESDLNTEFTITATVGFFEQAQSTLTATAGLECQATEIDPTRASADLDSETTLTCDAQSFTDSITLIVSTGTLAADITVIPPIRVSATLTATASLSVIIGEIEQFAVMAGGEFTQSTGINAIFDASATVATTVDQSTQAQKFTGIVATLTGFYSTLTQGDVINIDPFLTLMITEETGVLKIPAESRQLIIEQETRSLIIEGWE